MVARLLMLLGAFAGNKDTLSISETNPLKYYEKHAVYMFHNWFLHRAQLIDKSFQAHHAQNFTLTDISPQLQADFDVRSFHLTCNCH